MSKMKGAAAKQEKLLQLEREEKQLRSLLMGDRLFQSTKADAQSATGTARGLRGGKRTRPSQVEDGGKRVKVEPVTQSTASSPSTQIGATSTTQETTLLPAVGEESAADFLPNYDGEGGSEQGSATGVAADLDTTIDAGEHYNVCKEADQDNSFFTRLRNQRIREMYQTTHTFDVETRIRTVNRKGYNIQVIAEGGLPTVEQMLVVEEHEEGSEEENVEKAPEDADAPTQHVAAEEHAAKVLQQYRLDGSMVRDTEVQVSTSLLPPVVVRGTVVAVDRSRNFHFSIVSFHSSIFFSIFHLFFPFQVAGFRGEFDYL